MDAYALEKDNKYKGHKKFCILQVHVAITV